MHIASLTNVLIESFKLTVEKLEVMKNNPRYAIGLLQ